MKISISPRIMVTILLLGAIFSTANIVAMKEGEGASRRRSRSVPQQPRELSELEKEAIQSVQSRIARDIWQGTIQPNAIPDIAKEIKAAQENIIKEKREKMRFLIIDAGHLILPEVLRRINPLIDRYTANVTGAFKQSPLNIVMLKIGADAGEQLNQQCQDTIEKLLKAGANPNYVEESYQQTPLYIAAERNLPDLIRLLIAYGADPNQQVGSEQATPLMIAAVKSHLECVQALFEPSEKKPLFKSWKQAPPEIVSIITEEHIGIPANPMIKDRFDQTAADFASRDDIRKIIIKKMIDQLTADDALNGEILRQIVRGIYKCKDETTQKDLLYIYNQTLRSFGQDAAEIEQTTEALKAIDDFNQKMVKIYKPKTYYVTDGTLVRPEEADTKITEFIQPAINAIKELKGTSQQIASVELIRTIQSYEKKHSIGFFNYFYKENLHNIATELLKQELGYDLPPLQPK